MRTAHSAQIWRIFLPVYHRPSKMPGFLIWFYAILGRIDMPEMRFPGISVGNFFFDHVVLEIAMVGYIFMKNGRIFFQNRQCPIVPCLKNS